METAVGITMFMTAVVFFFTGAIVARLGHDGAQRHCGTCDEKLPRWQTPRCPLGHGCNSVKANAEGSLRLTQLYGGNRFPPS